jgi:hypothetical protein
MSYLFVVLMCTSTGCKFVTNGDLLTQEKCNKNMEIFEKIETPANVDFSVASCVKVKTKEKAL